MIEEDGASKEQTTDNRKSKESRGGGIMGSSKGSMTHRVKDGEDRKRSNRKTKSLEKIKIPKDDGSGAAAHNRLREYENYYFFDEKPKGTFRGMTTFESLEGDNIKVKWWEEVW